MNARAISAQCPSQVGPLRPLMARGVLTCSDALLGRLEVNRQRAQYLPATDWRETDCLYSG